MKKEIINTLEWLINFKSVSENKKETEALLNQIASKMNPNLIIKKHYFNGFSSLVIANTKEKNYDVVFILMWFHAKNINFKKKAILFMVEVQLT